ncbi:MAG: hypothetical protein GXP54_10725, partial [Deltaproteobacteria bacterium]|nr:hypothetical protein [Deltaproteobacteria bacterium]
FLAMVNLQAGIIRGNTTSWDIVQASNLAQHVLQSIRIEAEQWTNTSTQDVNQAGFRYLQHVNDTVYADGSRGSGWLKAFDQGTVSFQLVNQIGRDTGYDQGALTQIRATDNRKFCVRYRLTWLVTDYLIRAEVRVLWPRDLGNAGQYDACPINIGSDSDMQQDVSNVYSVTYPTTVMRNVFVQP